MHVTRHGATMRAADWWIALYTGRYDLLCTARIRGLELC
jgi:hypothetical protein